MDRAMLGVSLYDQINIATQNWQKAGHIALRSDERWGPKELGWRPQTGQYTLGILGGQTTSNATLKVNIPCRSGTKP
ncbi:jg17951 [Pararge aegeria aegeria]|uniref:Jg17951 protein n=1 Tax=Pararge aegeria aegeria TaxID=348720 RepID=A0A8S4S966_9NEOP|nr:jg17951 [Pararge aegeria aegeria]